MGEADRPPGVRRTAEELDASAKGAVFSMALMLAFLGAGLGLMAWGVARLNQSPADPSLVSSAGSSGPAGGIVNPEGGDAPASKGAVGTARDDVGSKIDALIEQLGDSRYSVRRDAQRALMDYGERARPALEEAARSQDAEVQHAALRLLRLLDDR